MNKFPLWLKLTVLGGALTALLVTTAGSFFMPSANTRNGLVYGYVPGKSITIRSFGRELLDYNLNSKTQVLPSDLASGLAAGAQVTVVGQCYSTSATSGCIALDIWVRTPAGSGASAATSAPAAPSAPVATPTP